MVCTGRWPQVRLGNLITLANGKSLDISKINDTGAVPIYGGGDIKGYTTESNCEAGTIIISRQGATCGTVRQIAAPFWATEHAMIVVPRHQSFSTRWLYYALANQNLGKLSMAAAQPGISQEKVKSQRVFLPAIAEQQRIADYLDEKCAEIDRAIEAAERSIEEMLKYRSSCLEETFNRLDGTYPKVKLKYVLEESKEKSVDGIGEPLSITIASGVLRSSELEVPNPASSMVGAKVVRAGDLVFNKLKAYFGVMYVSPYDGLISSEYAIYRALDPNALSLKYIEYLVHTNQIIDEFIIRISGVADGFRRLYTSDLFNISINCSSVIKLLLSVILKPSID